MFNNHREPIQVPFLIATIAILLLACSFLPIISAVADKLLKEEAITVLEDNGYWISPPDNCYPYDFVPCTDDTLELGSATNRWEKGWFGSESVYIGAVKLSNTSQQLDIDGQLIMHDAGKVWIEIQPDLDYASVIANGKPTQTFRGVHSGFSLPIYNDDNEELFVSMDVIREWDGITNPLIHIHCYIENNEAGFWVSPTSFIDGGGWADETLAYDNDVKAYTYNSIGATSWSNPITFTMASTLIDAIEFYATNDPLATSSINLDAYYNGAWHDVYQGVYTSKEWVSKPLGDSYKVTQYRMSFYNSDDNFKDAKLYETKVCVAAGNGNFNLEIAWSGYTVADNEIVSEDACACTVETDTTGDNYASYVVTLELDYDTVPANPLITAAQLGIRLRRITASENELNGEVVIAHIGIEFLRDKLGTAIP